jgi:hypothetical protein
MPSQAKACATLAFLGGTGFSLWSSGQCATIIAKSRKRAARLGHNTRSEFGTGAKSGFSAATRMLGDTLESPMTLKRYFPISVVVFVLVVGTAAWFRVPILPFAVILLVGETLMGFEMEDHKAAHFLKALFGRK